jgi:hypothetical protein
VFPPDKPIVPDFVIMFAQRFPSLTSLFPDVSLSNHLAAEGSNEDYEQPNPIVLARGYDYQHYSDSE